MRYHLKESAVHAIQYNREDNIHEVIDYFGADNGKSFRYFETINQYGVFVKGYGTHILTPSEYILRLANGDYKVMTEGEFKRKYEKVDEVIWDGIN